MMLRLLLALLCAGAVSLPAFAATEDDDAEPIDTAYEACIEKDPSTAGMIACAATAEEAWDKELNEVYGELVGELKGRSLETLREAQRAWIAQRDKEHALHAAIGAELDGTMWGPVMAEQRMALVKSRTLQLRAYKSFLDEGKP